MVRRFLWYKFFLHGLDTKTYVLNTTKGLAAMREFKSSLRCGMKCIAKHPSSDTWSVAKVIESKDESISLRFENWAEVQKHGIWHSQILPVDTFKKVTSRAPNAKRSSMKRKLTEEKYNPSIKDGNTNDNDGDNDDTCNKKDVEPEELLVSPMQIHSSKPGSHTANLNACTFYFKEIFLSDMHELIRKANVDDFESISAIGRRIFSYENVYNHNEKLRDHINESLEAVEVDMVINKALRSMDTWKLKKLKAGEFCDIYQSRYGSWYHSKVKTRVGNIIDVHYNGWAAKFDETIDLTDPDGVRSLIYPPHTFSTARKVTLKKVKRNTHTYIPVETIVVDGVEREDTYWNRTGTDAPESWNQGEKVWVRGKGYVDASEYKSLQEFKVSRTGRAIKSVVSTKADAPTTKPKRDKVRMYGERETDVEDNNDFLCSICEQLEADDHSDLILCDGPCLKSWHLGCMGSKDPSVFPDTWKCDDCESEKHQCYICDDYGRDNKDVFKCLDRKCGLYFHYSCLTQLDVEYKIIQEPSEDLEKIPSLGRDVYRKEFSPVKGRNTKAMTVKEVEESLSSLKEGSRMYEKTLTLLQTLRAEEAALKESQQKNMFIFKCPRHFCQTCYSFYGDNSTEGGGKKSKYFKRRPEALLRCIGKSCGKAYHFSCLPPGSRHGQGDLCLVCICNDHMSMPMPKAETSGCVERAPANNLLWDQLESFLPTDEQQSDKIDDPFVFRLPLSFRKDVNSAAPQFKHLFNLDYDSYPGGVKAVPIQLPMECCTCEPISVVEKSPMKKKSKNLADVENNDKPVKACGSRCLNRNLFIECYDVPGKKSDAICNVSDSCNGDCGNRQVLSTSIEYAYFIYPVC